MRNETAALVRQMREAVNALVDRDFTFFSGQMIGASKKITRDEVLAARATIAAADQWLAQQRGPLTDEEIDALDIGGYPKGTFNTRSEYDRAVRRMLARAIERAHGIGQPAGEDKPC